MFCFVLFCSFVIFICVFLFCSFGKVYPAGYFEELVAQSYSDKYNIPIEWGRVLVQLEEREVERGETYDDDEQERRRLCRLMIWRAIGALQN